MVMIAIMQVQVLVMLVLVLVLVLVHRVLGRDTTTSALHVPTLPITRRKLRTRIRIRTRTRISIPVPILVPIPISMLIPIRTRIRRRHQLPKRRRAHSPHLHRPLSRRSGRRRRRRRHGGVRKCRRGRVRVGGRAGAGRTDDDVRGESLPLPLVGAGEGEGAPRELGRALAVPDIFSWEHRREHRSRWANDDVRVRVRVCVCIGSVGCGGEGEGKRERGRERSVGTRAVSRARRIDRCQRRCRRGRERGRGPTQIEVGHRCAAPDGTTSRRRRGRRRCIHTRRLVPSMNLRVTSMSISISIRTSSSIHHQIPIAPRPPHTPRRTKSPHNLLPNPQPPPKHIPQRPLAPPNLPRRQPRQLRPRAIRVRSVLHELGREDQAREECPAWAEEGRGRGWERV